MVAIEITEWLEKEENTRSDSSYSLSPLFLQEVDAYFSDNIDRGHIDNLFQNISTEDQNEFWLLALQSFVWEGIPLEFLDKVLIQDEILALKSTENITQKTENITQNTESIAQGQSLIDNKFTSLQWQYDSLSDDIKPSENALQMFMNDYLNEDVSMRLENYGLNSQDYMRLRYTAEQIAQQDWLTPETLTFIQDFNTLNRSLDIDYQITLPGMKEEPTGWWNSLRDVISDPAILRKNNSVSSYVRWLSLPDITDEEIEKKAEDVSQTLVDNILREDGEEYYPQLFGYMNTTLGSTDIASPPSNKDARDRQMEEWYTIHGKEEVDSLYESLSKQLTAQHVLTMYQRDQKESVVHGAIRWLAQYFDSRNIRWENYARDFKLDTNNNISIDNNILHINGTMHGQIVHFFYNLETGELEANDYIHHLYQGDVFAINDSENGRVKLPQSLPTIGSLFKDTAWIGSTELSSGITSTKEYQEKTQSVLDKKLSKSLALDPLNRLYVARTNEKNLLMQETLDFVDGLLTSWGEHSLDNIVGSQEISRQRSPEVHRLLSLIDTTILSTRNVDAIRTMRNTIEKLTFLVYTRKIQEGRYPDSFVNAIFSFDAREKQTALWDWSEKWSAALIDFFSLVSTKNHHGGDQIDLSLLSRVVDGIEHWDLLDPSILTVHGQELYANIMEEDPDLLLDSWV